MSVAGSVPGEDWFVLILLPLIVDDAAALLQTADPSRRCTVNPIGDAAFALHVAHVVNCVVVHCVFAIRRFSKVHRTTALCLLTAAITAIAHLAYIGHGAACAVVASGQPYLSRFVEPGWPAIRRFPVDLDVCRRCNQVNVQLQRLRAACALSVIVSFKIDIVASAHAVAGDGPRCAGRTALPTAGVVTVVAAKLDAA